MTTAKIELDYTCGDGEELVTVIEDITNRGGVLHGIKRERGKWPRLIVAAPKDKMERILLEYCGGDEQQAQWLLDQCESTTRS